MASTARNRRAAGEPPPNTARVAEQHQRLQDPNQFLDKAFQDILCCEHGSYSYEELYSAVYRATTEYNNVETVFNSMRRIFSDPPKYKIVPKLHDAFKVDPENLHAVIDQYNRALLSYKQIAGICLYMQSIKGRSYDVMALGTTCFAAGCVQSDEAVRSCVQQTMLGMVERHRQTEAVEMSLCKSACNMLVAFDGEKRKIYEQLFERAFLEQSEIGFNAEAQQLLATKSLEKFVDGVFDREERELELCRRMLHDSTEPRLIDLLHATMVQEYLPQILDDDENEDAHAQGIQFLIETENFTVLKRLIKLLTVAAASRSSLSSRNVENGIDRLKLTFQLAFIKRATAIITKDEKSAELAEQLIEVSDLYIKVPESFSHQLFDADKKFEDAIRTGFINAIEEGKNKCSESLAFYADRLLSTKTNKTMLNEPDIEKHIEGKVLNIFRLLHDKDSFQTFYKQKLAKRLLSQSSFSTELEEKVVKLLNTECGDGYAGRLYVMFTNLATSRSLNDDYRARHRAAGSSVDISVEVLQSCAWPIKSLQAPQLSGAVDYAFQAFKAYYDGIHPHRRMKIVPAFGSAEVRATFYGAPQQQQKVSSSAEPVAAVAVAAAPTSSSSCPAGPSSRAASFAVVAAAVLPRTYLLLVNTAQMLILNLFAERSTWSFEDLLASTQLDEEVCRRNLQALAMAKKQRILKRAASVNSSSTNSEFAKDDKFCVNESFYSPQYRVKVLVIAPPAAQRAREEEQIRAQCIEERKPMINAALVRIMKARKQLQHNLLMSECVELIKKHFKPDVMTIKARIEALIEEEYFRRDENEHRLLHYVA